MKIVNILRFIWKSPLNKGKRIKAFARFFRWQVGSLILDKPIIWPFVNDARLVISRGMTAATGNIYSGLMEYNEMAFLLHYLRENDVFFDIGSNVGTYTILAAKVVGAQCVSIEPDPMNYQALLDNIWINRVPDIVEAYNIAAGRQKGRIQFCSGFGSVSCVRTEDAKVDSIEIDVVPIDHLAYKVCPNVLKIDVEGYESEVISGGKQILKNKGLDVVIMELRGHGKRYGFNERNLDQLMRSLGFKSCLYDPVARMIKIKKDNELGDMLYIRNIKEAIMRVTVGPKCRVG